MSEETRAALLLLREYCETQAGEAYQRHAWTDTEDGMCDWGKDQAYTDVINQIDALLGTTTTN